jgi:hypothetical protein
LRNLESKLQISCVTWFRYAYPNFKLNLFSVPNGGFRKITTAVTMQSEGALSGVSDLILLLPNKNHHALCLELKIRPNKQSTNQKLWGDNILKYGISYKVIYSFDDFQNEINQYIKDVNP